MNDYEAARDRYERAVEALRPAGLRGEDAMNAASDEWVAADYALRRFEDAPGIPKPEYLTGTSA